MSGPVASTHEGKKTYIVNRNLGMFGFTGDLEGCLKTYRHALDSGLCDETTFNTVLGVLSSFRIKCENERDIQNLEWVKRLIASVRSEMASRGMNQGARDSTGPNALPPPPYPSQVRNPLDSSTNGIPGGIYPQPLGRANMGRPGNGTPPSVAIALPVAGQPSDQRHSAEDSIRQRMLELDNNGCYDESWILYTRTVSTNRNLTHYFFDDVMKSLLNQLTDPGDVSLARLIFSQATEVLIDANKNDLLDVSSAKIRQTFQEIIDKLNIWGFSEVFHPVLKEKILEVKGGSSFRW